MDIHPDGSVGDEELLSALLRTHSHAAFSALVRKHASRFRNVAYRYVGSREEAEDIVQNAFLKLWDKPQIYNASNNVKFTTWFYRIVVNACLDYQRRHKSVPILEGEDFADDAMGADEMVAMHEQQRQVEKAFRSLPVDMQTSLNLSFFEPVPNREAAEIMGLSIKAFQSLLMRAKKSFKDRILSQEHGSARHYELR